MMTNSSLTDFLKDDNQPAVIRYLEAIFAISDNFDVGVAQFSTDEKDRWISSNDTTDQLIEMLKMIKTPVARRCAMMLKQAQIDWRAELIGYNIAMEIIVLAERLSFLWDRIDDCRKLRDEISLLKDAIAEICAHNKTSLPEHFITEQQQEIKHELEALANKLKSYERLTVSIGGYICELLTATRDPRADVVGTSYIYALESTTFDCGPVRHLGIMNNIFREYSEDLMLTCTLSNELNMTGMSEETNEFVKRVNEIYDEVERCLDAHRQIEVVLTLWRALVEQGQKSDDETNEK